MAGNLKEKFAARPAFPKRAVITGGMPYGNKGLHFGHIGGYFIHADVLARFLRDRIGHGNVIFVSGTDCYGSPITEDFRKKSESGEASGSIDDFVRANHLFQKSVLDEYQISLDLFAASSLPPAAENHRRMSAMFIRALHGNGHLAKLSTSQFYDPDLRVFLNGRQVIGRCPVAGCQSEKGYADECDLGHQYLPSELIDPKSTLSGRTPEMREAVNWYVRMDAFRDLLRSWVDEFSKRPNSRPFAVRAIEEFLEPPVIYLKRDFVEAVESIAPAGAAEVAAGAAGAANVAGAAGVANANGAASAQASASNTASAANAAEVVSGAANTVGAANTANTANAANMANAANVAGAACAAANAANANGTASAQAGAYNTANTAGAACAAANAANANGTAGAASAPAAPRPSRAMPPHEIADDGKSTSVKLIFATLAEREQACALISGAGINYRTGKTLVPFRLTGNIEWGVPAPELDGVGGLTVWVWPESLWAPISFTKTYLESVGKPEDEWQKWWMSRDARVYQFIGQDNIYFYGPAQSAMFMGMQGREPSASPADGQLALTDLIVSNHLLFFGKKASSSGKEKPPMAHELLEHYTPEQLRAHFLGLGLGIRSVSFQPKPLNAGAKPGDPDPVLKEGNMLTNVLNRVARSCFYTAQKYTDGRAPELAATDEAAGMAAEAALDYEALMFRCEFHQVMSMLDVYVRNINKYWARRVKEADEADKADGKAGDAGSAEAAIGGAASESGGGLQIRLQALADGLHMLRVAAVLTHPIAPDGSEMIAEYLNMANNFFDWEDIFRPFRDFIADPATHRLRFLEPRVDFFKKHESQFAAQ
ncbi:MAG: class I tRNA ligase family protein [Clostridiales bacterium]|jgi:methionyl-tRNA synthetase|nr:class I tRNA ligase family protein [Clostridiales bacterium]